MFAYIYADDPDLYSYKKYARMNTHPYASFIALSVLSQ